LLRRLGSTRPAPSRAHYDRNYEDSAHGLILLAGLREMVLGSRESLQVNRLEGKALLRQVQWRAIYSLKPFEVAAQVHRSR
jgi:hypothetical protein